MIWSRCKSRTGTCLRRSQPLKVRRSGSTEEDGSSRAVGVLSATRQLPRYGKRVAACVSNYLGALHMIGDQIARLTSYIEKRNIRKKTLVLFTADHGDYMTGCGVRLSNAVESAFTSMGDIMPTMCDARSAQIFRMECRDAVFDHCCKGSLTRAKSSAVFTQVWA